MARAFTAPRRPRRLRTARIAFPVIEVLTLAWQYAALLPRARKVRSLPRTPTSHGLPQPAGALGAAVIITPHDVIVRPVPP